jgi:hypothetical protein
MPAHHGSSSRKKPKTPARAGLEKALAALPLKLP